MLIGPIHAGDIDPPLYPQLIYRDGSQVSLAGITSYTLYLRDRKTGRSRPGQGTFSVFDPVQSILQYTWSATDTAIPGIYYVYIAFYYTGGGHGTTLENELEILPFR